MTDRMLSTAETAQRLGVSTKTLSNWRCKRVGPSWVKPSGAVGTPGGRVTYRESVIKDWLDVHTVEAQEVAS